HMGGHIGGYTPFEVDVTDIVAPGEQFRLTVAVSNLLDWTTIPPGRVIVDEYGGRTQNYQHDFFNYAGIARSVWFYSVPDVYINDIAVTTEVQDGGAKGIVNFAVTTNKDSNSSQARISLIDEEGNEVSEASQLEGALEVNAPNLWQPGAAYLYSLRVELLSGNGEGAPLDIYELPVGIRSVEVRGTQFLINDEPFYFTGFGKHEDTAVRGKGYDPAYMVHDFNLMDWIGANSFRTSHYPYAEEVYEYCDRHGIVVVDEVAAVGLNPALMGVSEDDPDMVAYSPDTISNKTQATHAQAIRELVHRDKNHASVVMWVIANEPAAHEDGALEYFQPLVELARELDPTRPMTFTSEGNAVPSTDLITELFDVISLNRYYGWYSFTGDLEGAERGLESELLDWHNAYEKPILMSEYGADTIPGFHAIHDVLYTEEYQTRFLEMYHRVFDRIPSVVGEHVWAFADFQTPNTNLRRIDGNKKGVFTRDRKPKAAAHTLRARWTEGVPKAGGEGE
ncbi:beta-glucuronidase, partial [Candidatus Bathyarchaeota archaeon]|nr:beta-glucuronidase [Candidatus Bathyarchaeota archaeon]